LSLLLAFLRPIEREWNAAPPEIVAEEYPDATLSRFLRVLPELSEY